MNITILNLKFYKDRYMRLFREYIKEVKYRRFMLKRFKHK
jgi:hypothetical protein